MLNPAAPMRPGEAVETPWLSRLMRARSGDELRAALLSAQAGFDPATLKRVAILGAAKEGGRLAQICRSRGIDVAAIADDDPNKTGTTLEGFPVRPSSELDALARDTPIVIASHRVTQACERLKKSGFVHVAPFAALQVLDPIAFPPHMFYDRWLDDLWVNRARYGRFRDMLTDDQSLRVLDTILGYRQTLDPAVFGRVVRWDLYGPNGLLRLGDDEVYVDGGSYDGDTVRLFVDRVAGRFDRVLAFEPDRQNFTRLKTNFAAEPRIETFNAGLYREHAVLRFRADGSRDATFFADGTEDMDVVALDEVLKGDRVTYIKMNIEGAEIDALKGAAGSIARWTPKLAIAVYHRPSDLWQIAEVVRGLNPNYDLYLRQHDGGVIETVLYALPRP